MRLALGQDGAGDVAAVSEEPIPTMLIDRDCCRGVAESYWATGELPPGDIDRWDRGVMVGYAPEWLGVRRATWSQRTGQRCFGESAMRQRGDRLDGVL